MPEPVVVPEPELVAEQPAEETPQPAAQRKEQTMKTKYNVKQALEFLSQFPEDADVRGFGAVKVTPKTVSVKASAPQPPAPAPSN